MDWDRIAPRRPASSPPACEVMRAALQAARRSLDGLLRDAIAARQPVLLLVNDSHRATRSADALAAIAEMAPREARFRALVAAGTHRFSLAERQAFERDLFGATALPVEAIAWHDAEDASSLRECGGARMHAWLADSRMLLPIGSVEPHYFAGVTGAHKTCTIGVLARGDIERNHAGALDPRSDVFALRGNPVFDGIAMTVDALRAAGKQIVAVNQLVAGEALLASAAGDVFGSLDALMPAARGVFLHALDAPADLLHLRVPSPLGRSLYQADKALKNNHRAVRDGGAILLEAACEEGVGPDAFFGLLREAPDFASAVECVRRRGYRLGDHKAVKLRHLTDPACRGVRVALVSRGVQAAEAESAGLRAFADVDRALSWLSEVCAPVRRAVLVEDAGNVSAAARDHSAARG